MSAKKLLLIWWAPRGLVCSRHPRDWPDLALLMNRLEQRGCKIEGAATEKKLPPNVRPWTHGDPGSDYFVDTALG